jgi:hypothetical protein
MKLSTILAEGLEQDYYVKKTTAAEVKDLLLRGHYLGAWPFAGSQFKDYIYGIYLKRAKKQMPLVPGEEGSDDLLVGCIVYGFPEFHASSYVSKWLRTLLDPEESIESIYQNIRQVITKDAEEERKAKERGYPYSPKAKPIIQNILNATNIQDKQILELKRLYILPEHDLKNIESFAIGKGNKMIFDGNPTVQVIVSFSDSKAGHHGGVYQATNALYAGINKPGLHRYIYPRDNLAATIKKYQQDYENLVFQYPKPKPDSGEPETDWEFDKLSLSKRERIVARYLKNLIPTVDDESIKAAVSRVLDFITKSSQSSFRFAEVTNMVLSDLLIEYVMKTK